MCITHLASVAACALTRRDTRRKDFTVNEPTAKTPGANAESSPLNLRAPHDVIARLTRVASKLPPGLFSKHRLAVLALEHGLAVIERDPMILLRGPVVAPGEPPPAAATPGAAPSPPEVPAVAVAPAAPAPEARVERVERAPRVVSAVASAPVVDPRQLPLTAAASDAPVSESTPSPSEPSADVDALTRANEALRVRYRAALAAKLLTGEATAKRVGCSEGTLRQWKDGAIQNLGGDKDPEGKWLAALTAILDALDANASTP